MGITSSTYCCSTNHQPLDHGINFDALDFRGMDYSNPEEVFKKMEKFSKEFTQKLGIRPENAPLIERILKNKQEHLLLPLANFDTRAEKLDFLRNVNKVDLQLMDSLYYNLVQKAKYQQTQIVPCDFLDIDIFDEEMRINKFELGLKAIKNKEVGVFLLAGGTNNRFHSVKFLKQIPGFKKTLLELIFIRLKEVILLSHAEECPIHIYIMCSDQNYNQIKRFLELRSYFNIPMAKIDIILQSQIPVLSLNGKIILNSNSQIVLHPRGAGQFINSFHFKSNVLETNIKYLYVSGLENMLQKPCDPLLIGEMIAEGMDIAAKCVDPLDSNQDMLRYAKLNGVIKCMDPSILKQKSKAAKDIRYQKSPVMMNSVVFRTDYLKKLLAQPQLQQISKQIHSTTRKFTYLDLRRQTLNVQQECYVFENHLADLFFNTKKILLFKVKREEDFAPVITQQYEHSFFQAKLALESVHKRRRQNQVLTTLRLFTEKQILPSEPSNLSVK